MTITQKCEWCGKDVVYPDDYPYPLHNPEICVECERKSGNGFFFSEEELEERMREVDIKLGRRKSND